MRPVVQIIQPQVFILKLTVRQDRGRHGRQALQFPLCGPGLNRLLLLLRCRIQLRRPHSPWLHRPLDPSRSCHAISSRGRCACTAGSCTCSSSGSGWRSARRRTRRSRRRRLSGVHTMRAA
ncbi:hypothetical protein B0H14DRAFT_3891083 [Mycena olivaceomarginata]|nr:hypothetical protein B0H14DRAFT_3891083 [Mycena olivaceomarginata]